MVDVLLYSVGYEHRSGYLAASGEVSARIAFVFGGPHVLSFHQNLAHAKARNDVLIAENEIDANLPSALDKLADDLGYKSGRAGKTISIMVDVSSMSRRMMAIVLHFLLVEKHDYSLKVSINYSFGMYLPPAAEEASFMDFSPAPFCEGWTVFPERPLSVVLGLGYEVDQAIGAIEYLDPSGIWAFTPVGTDPRFFRDLQRANESLWPLLDVAHRVRYEILEPYLLFAELRGLVAALSQRSRVVIVPGGPKLFSALALLTKFELGEEVSIWRASTNEFNAPRDVQASGETVVFDYKPPRLKLINMQILDETGA